LVHKTHNTPKNVPQAFSQYSHFVVVEGAQKLVFCAGQVAGDEQGNLLGPDDFEAQGELVIATNSPLANTICVLRGLAHPNYLLEIDATTVV
jgi:2-iminobutanoate/2-iminopropanoate deaminase